MGNCTGGCNACSESKAERRAMKEYQQSIMKPTPNPNTKSKSKSKSNAKRKSIEIISSRSTTNSNAESSTISNLSPHIQPSYTSNPDSISSPLHAKTMELLSYDEDDKSIELDHENDDEQIALSSFEVNDSNLRIRRLSNTKNSFELEQLLHEQYSQDDEGMEEDDGSDSESGSESELSPQEMLEIERRKSDQIIKERKSLTQQPNLLRSDTTTEWQKDDIEKLQNDMKKELLSLQDINSNKDKTQKHKKRNSNKNYKIGNTANLIIVNMNIEYENCRIISGFLNENDD